MDDAANQTVTIGIASLDDTKRQVAAAFRNEMQGHHIAFASVELLWSVLTAKRWEILQAMCGRQAGSIRDVARRVGRDVKAVHGDIQALLLAGLLDKTDDGKVLFPYAAVRVDFTLRAA